MITKNISMPHPVLGINGDFKDGAFITKLNFRLNKINRKYSIENIQVEITNSYIKSMYEQKKIDFVLKICCTPTYKSWTRINQYSIELPENEIDTLIEIDSYLLASGALEYFDESFADDFDSKVFNLEKGDIVAMSGTQKIPIRKENEKVTLGSIFRFSKIDSNMKDQELYFNYDEDQIAINYPAGSKEFDPVTLLFDKVQGLPYTALNVYIMPALTEAFRIILENEGSEFSDKKWFIVLDSLLPKNKRIDDPFICAQLVVSTGIPSILSFEEYLKFKNINQ